MMIVIFKVLDLHPPSPNETSLARNDQHIALSFSGYIDYTPAHMKALRLHSSIAKSCFALKTDFEELQVIPTQLMDCKMVLCSVSGIAVL